MNVAQGLPTKLITSLFSDFPSKKSNVLEHMSASLPILTKTGTIASHPHVAGLHYLL